MTHVEEGRISGGWAEYVLLHSYTGTVMKEQGGWHLLPVLSFYEWSKLNARPNLAMFHGAPLSVCVESVRSQNRETPKRGIFMLIERRFPSISPILSALSLSLLWLCPFIWQMDPSHSLVVMVATTTVCLNAN